MSLIDKQKLPAYLLANKSTEIISELKSEDDIILHGISINHLSQDDVAEIVIQYNMLSYPEMIEHKIMHINIDPFDFREWVINL